MSEIICSDSGVNAMWRTTLLCISATMPVVIALLFYVSQLSHGKSLRGDFCLSSLSVRN